jgi:hypothetical protein
MTNLINKLKEIIRHNQFFATALIIVICMAIWLTGCYQNAQTGEWQLGQQAADQIENIADTATGALSLVSLFVPGAAGVAGIAAGAAAAFKKMKPGLTKYKQTSEHIVTSIEQIKEDQPELWKQIKDKFKDGTNADIEQVIEQIVALAKTKETA